MRHPRAQISEHKSSGYWRIFVDPLSRGGANNSVDVTLVRNAPTAVSNITTTDPFGPGTATLIFPSITIFDTPGAGDIEWLVPEANVDICWMAPKEQESDPDVILYKWEGYFLSFEYGEDDAGGTLTVECNGAMKQIDNFLATPEYVSRPLSYEQAISRQFSKVDRPSSRLAEVKSFAESVPSWYDKKFNKAAYDKLDDYLRPVGIANGTQWSGLLTRSTGNFDPALTSYVQALLSSMGTNRGAFTLMLDSGRQPVFKHRDRLYQPNENTLVVDLLWPGVSVSATRDFSQKLNVVYGRGRGLDGNSFSNLNYSANGEDAFIEPFSARRQVHPISDGNKWLDKNKMRKEVSLTFYDGLSQAEASDVAAKHLEIFSDPGVTGTLTLKTDPLLNNELFARQRIVAGMSVQIKGMFGDPNGILFHFTETSMSEDGTFSATIDSKFRDQLTVQEVRKRGRDSLVTNRVLDIGKYQSSIDDLLFPWSYPNGSGYVGAASNTMWKRALNDTTLKASDFVFPWKFPSYPNYRPSKAYSVINNDKVKNGKSYFYAKLGPASNQSQNNWVRVPIRLSAAGQIRLFQIAAYDKNGNILKVPFHVSLYYQPVTSAAMPRIPSTKSTSVQVTNNAYVTVAGTTSGYRLGTITRLPTGHGFNVGDYIWLNAKGSKKQETDGRFVVTQVVGANSVKVKFATSVNTVSNRVTAVSKATLLVYGTNTQPYYDAGSPHPFFESAWENVRKDGGTPTDLNVVTSAGNDPFAGWGTYYSKPGYWPNISPSQASSNFLTTEPTGLFVTENPFSFDFRNMTNGVNTQDTRDQNMYTGSTNGKTPVYSRITAYAMIYCDQEWDPSLGIKGELKKRTSEVYFIGRMFRQVPGTE